MDTINSNIQKIEKITDLEKSLEKLSLENSPIYQIKSGTKRHSTSIDSEPKKKHCSSIIQGHLQNINKLLLQDNSSSTQECLKNIDRLLSHDNYSTQRHLRNNDRLLSQDNNSSTQEPYPEVTVNTNLMDQEHLEDKEDLEKLKINFLDYDDNEKYLSENEDQIHIEPEQEWQEVQPKHYRRRL